MEMNTWGQPHLPKPPKLSCYHRLREGYWQKLSWLLQVKSRMHPRHSKKPPLSVPAAPAEPAEKQNRPFLSFCREKGQEKTAEPWWCVLMDTAHPQRLQGRASNPRASSSPLLLPLGTGPAAPETPNKFPSALGASWAQQELPAGVLGRPPGRTGTDHVCQQLPPAQPPACAQGPHPSPPSQGPVPPARGCWSLSLGSEATPTLTPSCFSLDDHN